MESHWLGTKGPRPPTPSQRVPLKWEKSPEAAVSAASHSEQRWGVKVGFWCGLGWELGDSGKGSRFVIFLKSGGSFLLVRFHRAADGGWGALGVSREGVHGEWGTLSPKDGALEPKSREAPPPS